MSDQIVPNTSRSKVKAVSMSIQLAGNAATGRAPLLLVWGHQGVASSFTNSMTNWFLNQSHPPEEAVETTLGMRQTIQALKRVPAVTMTRSDAIQTLYFNSNLHNLFDFYPD